MSENDLWTSADAQNLRLKAERLNSAANELLDAADEVEERVDAHVRSREVLKFEQGREYEAVKTALTHYEEVLHSVEAMVSRVKQAAETLRETELQSEDHH